MTNSAAIPDIVLHRFHRSLYISLALACACLTYVEWWFLPEVVVLAVLVAVAMFVAYRAENKWSLSLRAANAVGAGIALLLAVWAVFHFMRPQGTLLDYLPIQGAMLVYLGPLVMILIPAKLFRPKHIGDYWSMQLIGLMTVALAFALGGNSGLGIFAMLYAVAAVWCLTDFHSVVNRGMIDVSNGSASTANSIRRVGGWTLAAMGLAFVFSLATPRNTDAQWGIGGLVPRATIGNPDDRQNIDLNLTGGLEVTDEVAFVVRAETADGQPKLDLAPAQKWRGGSFNFYDQGKWVNRGWPRQNNDARFGDRGFNRNARTMPYSPQNAQRMTPLGLPDFGPKQFFLIFPYPPRPRGTFYLANPIWPPVTRVGAEWSAPVVTELGTNRFNWVALRDGEVFPPLSIPGDRSKAVYRQVTAPTPEPGLSLPVVVDPALRDLLIVLVGLKPLREYSNTLLQQLVAANQVPNLKTWTPATGPPPIERHEEIARALEKYFHSSGAFEYDIQSLKRVDLTIDPIEDFLLNVRQGHCNRFATALTLVLRAQGIPARIVIGYEGCESSGDGSYVVRQMHAHSWVECLVKRNQPDGNATWHWLTLDPSPVVERVAASPNRLAKWLEETMVGVGEFFRAFVMELNAERQDRARSALAFLSPFEWMPRLYSFLKTPFGWTALGIGLISAVWLRRRGQRHDGSISEVYNQVRRSLVSARLFELNPGVTPLELRHLVQNHVHDQDTVAAVNSVIDCHNHIMYGGQTASIEQLKHASAAPSTVAAYCRRHRQPPPVAITP